MSVLLRTVVLGIAALSLFILASCSGTATSTYTPQAKDAAAKPAPKPTAVASVNPAGASAPVLAHFSSAGSTAAAGATIVKWEWKFGGGWENHTATAGEVWQTYTTVGTKVAHLRVTDSNGQLSTPVHVKLSVRANANAAPIASVNIATADGNQFQFDASESYDPDGSIVLYEWDLDNDGTFNLVSNNPNAGTTFGGGLHTVVLRVTDNKGATATRTFDVTGNFAPNAVITVVGDPVPGSGSYTYTLSFADSSDVEGPLYDATVSINGGTPELVDINEPFEVEAYEGDEPTSLVLTVRDGLWATGTALASISFEDGVVIALP